MRRIRFEELSNYTTEARGKVKRIYGHWSGGHYGQYFDDYHLNIDYDGSIYTDMDSLLDFKEHTYMRNTGAVGISLSCCYKAKPPDLYGDEPPTEEQLDMLSKIVAKLCYEIGLDVDSAFYTHDEIADNKDGVTWLYEPYGYNSTCERWDLHNLGYPIRRKAKEYIAMWERINNGGY